MRWTTTVAVAVIAASLVAGGAGCGSDDGPASAADGAGGNNDGGTADQGLPAPTECKPESSAPQLVKLTTDDGLTLEADLYLAGKASAPAAVLLHMKPPENDRKNFPPALIEALVGRGLTVLNVDRRGAGGSQGVAEEAYLGPNGKLDARAAHDFLRAHACPVDPQRIVYIGASNGTATVVDFTLFSLTLAAIARPAAAVLLSGGTYTDAQTSLLEQRGLFEEVPTLFVYAAAERQWPEAIKAVAAPGWEFVEYEGSAHGTALLTDKPESIELVASFVARF